MASWDKQLEEHLIIFLGHKTLLREPKLSLSSQEYSMEIVGTGARSINHDGDMMGIKTFWHVQELSLISTHDSLKKMNHFDDSFSWS